LNRRRPPPSTCRCHLSTAAADPVATTLARLNAQLLVRGWLSANNIVFRDAARGGAVVDTGYVSHAPQTLALIEQALGGLPLAEVVNTHLHSDHCGANAALARRWPELRITVPAASRSKLLPWDEHLLSYRETGQRCEPFTPRAFVDDGDTVMLGGRTWQVHAAPGHDPDAVLLFEPETATLISGDALWENRLAIIFPELSGDPGFDAAHDALDRIEQLSPRLVLPGHGQAFTEVASALAASRQRLRAFAATPSKHRVHAARALIAYHMLEHRRRPRQALVDWVAVTPIFVKTLQCEGDPPRAQALAGEIVDRLVADGVLALQAPGDETWVVLNAGE
jgi:glyoxylase-like metal-dependent hydrolase (beta-lactamase superfamily II)